MLLIETVKTSQEKQEEKKKGSDLSSTIFVHNFLGRNLGIKEDVNNLNRIKRKNSSSSKCPKRDSKKQ